MSLNDIKNNLINLVNDNDLNHQIKKNNPEEIVALYGDNNVLTYDNYTPDKLEKLTKKYNDIKINRNFWNSDFCDKGNLLVDNYENKINIDAGLNFNITKGLNIGLNFGNNKWKNKNRKKYSKDYEFGKLLYEIEMAKSFNSFFINNRMPFKFEKIKFAEFLINYNHRVSLTLGYLELIIKVFSDLDDYNYLLTQFLFIENYPRFEIEETRIILEKINIEDIDYAGYLIKELYIGVGEKLLYYEVILKTYNGNYIMSNNVGLSDKNKNDYLGYFLLTLDIENSQHNLYGDVLKNYINIGGSLNFDFLGDEKKNKELRKRKKFIKNFIN